MLIHITDGSIAALHRLANFLETAATNGSLYNLSQHDDILWATEIVTANGTIPEEYSDTSGGFTVDAQRYERDLAEAIAKQTQRTHTWPR